MLQDKSHHRVVAARSSDGDASLLWGETARGCLLFSTTEDSAINDETDAADFPAGALFVSSLTSDKLYDGALLRQHPLTLPIAHASPPAALVKRACPGRLVSFQQLPAGAMRRVRSRGGLARVSSGADVTQIKTFAAGALRTSPSLSELFASANELSAKADA